MKDGLTQVKELKDKIHEQYMEIQELNKRAEDLKTINEEHQILNGMLRKENDRLNNIINELEKELKERYLDFKDSECEEIKASAYEDISILERLKKLKGVDKE